MFLENIFKGLFLGVTGPILLYTFFKLCVTLLAKTFCVCMVDIIIVFLIIHCILLEISVI